MIPEIFSDGYGIIPKRIMRCKELSVYSKTVIAYFLSYTGGGRIECWPKIATIAEDLQISESTVKKAIIELVNNGLVEKLKLYDDPLKNNNKYRITILENAQDVKGYFGQAHNNSPTGAEYPSESHVKPLINNNIINNNIMNNNTNGDKSPSKYKFILKNNTEYNIPQSIVDKYIKKYEGIDVPAEFEKMAEWCEVNPTRRKTVGGISRFISGWLQRTAERKGTIKDKQSDIMEKLFGGKK